LWPTSLPLVPPQPSSFWREADPFEILMVRRNDKVAFMAGSYVFPGGRVDEGESTGARAELRPAIFSDLSDAQEAAYRTAAVRELQEEANVTITVEDLFPLAHWVTPEIEIRRYDTRFFLARMPAGQTAKHDEGETTALDWLSPREAIARFERKELLLPPPTWTTIRSSRIARRSRMRWAGAIETDRSRDAGLLQGRRSRHADAAGRSAVSDDSRLGIPEENAIRAGRRRSMAAAQG
jgi:8-oxo-dGTP pyrophosphatase MutT (NUDIX family)